MASFFVNGCSPKSSTANGPLIRLPNLPGCKNVHAVKCSRISWPTCRITPKLDRYQNRTGPRTYISFTRIFKDVTKLLYGDSLYMGNLFDFSHFLMCTRRLVEYKEYKAVADYSINLSVDFDLNSSQARSFDSRRSISGSVPLLSPGSFISSPARSFSAAALVYKLMLDWSQGKPN